MDTTAAMDGGAQATDAGLVVYRGGRRLILWSLVIGVVCLALVVLGAIFDFRQAAFSYLMAFIFWHTLAFGALIHLMIQHAINASWAIVVRRIAESAASSFTIILVLFLPLIAGLHDLYPWVGPPLTLPNEPALLARIQHRSAYLNVTFFYLRAAAYFAVWIVISWLLQRWTLRQNALLTGSARADDASGDAGAMDAAGEDVARADKRRALAHWQRVLSSLALPIVSFVITFASIDWVMSLEPEWFSTIFGVYYFSGAALAFVALLTLSSILLQREGYLNGVVTISHYHALGKLMLVFVIFWGYIAFVQLLLIWIADIPREAEWFILRSHGSWAIGAALLIFGHFGVTFFALLSWRLKRRLWSLAAVSAWVLVMHFIDVYWLAMPALHREGVVPHWLDLAALFGIGGVVVAYGVWRFRGREVAPVGDPRYPKSLEFYTT
jgi:hypothetical protein